MTRPDHWLVLAERCEKATEPDLKLNGDILRALGWRSVNGVAVKPDGMAASSVPHLTASLDAAMTLLPGMAVLISLSEIKGDGMPMAIVGNPETSDLFEAVAETMPLALCAAALRARRAA